MEFFAVSRSDMLVSDNLVLSIWDIAVPIAQVDYGGRTVHQGSSCWMRRFEVNANGHKSEPTHDPWL